MIWFMTPDLGEASGGLQMIYAMVTALERSGIPACVWHGTEAPAYGFASNTPTHQALSVDLDPGDVLVMPETGGVKWQSLVPGIPVVKLVQGFSFVFDDLTADSDVAPGYPGWPNVGAAIVISEYIERVVRMMSGPGVEVFRVPPMVDDSLFAPRPKKRTIAYMPRRRQDDLVAAIQLLKRSGSLPAGWSITPIDGLAQGDVARVLGESAIFLSGAYRDGFGLPGAEAMAAGCYVVGYTGDGGREYLTDEVASVIHDNDVLGMAEEVAAAARLFDAGDSGLRSRIEAGGSRIRDRYSRQAMTRALVATFTHLTDTGSPHVIATRAHVDHYQAHAPKSGLWWSAYRGARRLARHSLDSVRRS